MHLPSNMQNREWLIPIWLLREQVSNIWGYLHNPWTIFKVWSWKRVPACKTQERFDNKIHQRTTWTVVFFFVRTASVKSFNEEKRIKIFNSNRWWAGRQCILGSVHFVYALCCYIYWQCAILNCSFYCTFDL